MQKHLIFLILLSLILMPLMAKSYAEWQTSMGSFRCILHEDLVPITANNFIDLARANFYDGLIFHRVIEDFVIQDGCPNGNGTGGPGYSIPDEFCEELRHDGPGVLAMANAGPNTGGSQYYITLAATPWLDDSYSIFGNVITGLDTVMAIGSVETNSNDKPLVDVVIDSIRIFDFQINGIYPEESVLTYPENTALYFMVLATGYELTPIYEWTINGEYVGNSFSLNHTFTEGGEYEVVCTVSDGTYAVDTNWQITIESIANDDETVTPAAQAFQIVPNPFNPETSVAFNMEEPGQVRIDIYNTRGQKVRSLVDGRMERGQQNVLWNGRDDRNQPVTSGVYMIQLVRDGQSSVRKALMLK